MDHFQEYMNKYDEMMNEKAAKPHKTKEEFIKMFTVEMNNIKRQLKIFQKIVDSHFNYDYEKLNYGHIGTAKHIKKELEGIIKQVK